MTLSDLKREFLPLLAPEDFFILLSHATGKRKEFLLAHPEYGLDPETEPRAREFFARRLKCEPVAHITGEKEFYGLPFHVTPDTLIPRPETELLVELALREAESRIKDKESSEEKILIADIGTGSGAIIVSLAIGLRNLNPQFSFHAIDISGAAIDVARENAKRNGIADMITFHEGNLIEPIKKYFHAADEIILVANLPYLSNALYADTARDVKDYEPENALVSGDDGLDHYRALFGMTVPLPTSEKNISLLCEISPEQDTLSENLAKECFPERTIRIHADLSGRARVLEISLK